MENMRKLLNRGYSENQKAIRKELRTLSATELDLFMTTMRKFRDSGLYTRMGLVHRRSGVHSGPSFLTWHRESVGN
jgi:hypothetical protein